MDIRIKKFKPTLEQIQKYLESRRAGEEHALFNLSFYLQKQLNTEPNTILVADLSDMSFDNEGKGPLVDLRGGDFSCSILKNVKFKGCDLTDSSFCDTELTNVFFENTTINGVDFRGAELDTCEFSKDYRDWSEIDMSKRGSGLKFSTKPNIIKEYADIKSEKEKIIEKNKLIYKQEHLLELAKSKLSYAQLLFAKMGAKTNNPEYDQAFYELDLMRQGIFPESWHMIHKSFEYIFSDGSGIFDPTYVRGSSEEEKNQPKEYVHLSKENVISFLEEVKGNPNLTINEFAYRMSLAKGHPSKSDVKVIADVSYKFNYDEDSEQVVNLAGVDFSNVNLVGACLTKVNFKGANFSGADISRATFEYSDLQGARFENTVAHYANFVSSNLSQTIIKGSDFRYANLQYSYADNLSIESSNFSYVEAKKINWNRATINSSEIEYSNFEYASLPDVQITNSNCKRINLMNANLQNAVIGNCDFSSAFMNEALFLDSKIHNSLFVNVIARGANYKRSVISGVSSFAGSNLEGMNLKRSKADKISFDNSILNRINLRFADLQGSNFNNCSIKNAKLEKALLNKLSAKNAIFTGGNLSYLSATCANFSNCKMDRIEAYQANFTGADLSSSDMSGSLLQEAIFDDCKLAQSNLSDSILIKASMINVNISDCRINHFTDISSAKGKNITGLFQKDGNNISFNEHKELAIPDEDENRKSPLHISNLEKYQDEDRDNELDSFTFKLINQILVSLAIKT